MPRLLSMQPFFTERLCAGLWLFEASLLSTWVGSTQGMEASHVAQTVKPQRSIKRPLMDLKDNLEKNGS